MPTPGDSLANVTAHPTLRAVGAATPHTVRVLLVCDDEYLRLGVRTLFDRLPGVRIVDEATSTSQALRLVAALQPDLTVIEPTGLENNGLSACSTIASRLPGTRLLLWSSVAVPDTQVQQAGALGCLSRRASPRELVQAIHTAAHGRALPSSDHTSFAVPSHHTTAPSPSILDRLSRQERRLLTLVAEGMINRDIANTLGLSEKTIKNYLTSVYIKLGISRRTEAVRLVTQLYHTGLNPATLHGAERAPIHRPEAQGVANRTVTRLQAASLSHDEMETCAPARSALH
ncbi:MAG: response regulator transcription factor [Nitrospiraceae bacterium]